MNANIKIKCSSALQAAETLIHMTHLLTSRKPECSNACVKASTAVIKTCGVVLLEEHHHSQLWFSSSKWVQSAVKTPTLRALSGRVTPLCDIWTHLHTASCRASFSGILGEGCEPKRSRACAASSVGLRCLFVLNGIVYTAKSGGPSRPIIFGDRSFTSIKIR